MLRLHRLGVVLVAVGCSPVKDPSNVPDAAIDAMDMRPPMVASSVPADMGTKVSVVEPISIFFDEPIDPSSVSATTVKLAYIPPGVPFLPVTVTFVPAGGAVNADQRIPVRATATYDAAARKISIDPAGPLVYGAVHEVTLNVKDTAGLPLMTKLTFITYVNAQTKQYFYNSSTGAPSSWLGNPTNMDGRWTKRVGGNSPGVDGNWFTQDDPRNQHTSYNVAPDGRILDERIHGSGPDSQFDTADDVIGGCVQYKYDANKLITERTYPSTAGPDNMHCTADDVPQYIYQFTYTGATLTGYVWWTDDGVDNAWRTSDDRCSQFFEYEYDAASQKTREIQKGCGADGLPRTADDAVLQYFVHEYDASGGETRQNIFAGSGPDAIWFTADDVYASGSPFFPGVLRYTRNPAGSITDSILSTGAGTDAMWGTADDLGSRTATTYNMQGLAEKTVFYSSNGADMMWGTSDDVISSYVKTTYEANGNRIDQLTYLAGSDGMWETVDDRLITDNDFDINR